jgi:hypothetical protein
MTGVSVTILAEKTGSDTTFGANQEISWIKSRYSAFTSITTKFFACFMGYQQVYIAVFSFLYRSLLLLVEKCCESHD